MTIATASDLFDGVTFNPQKDGPRLKKQFTTVFDAMKDGHWRTVARIHAMTGFPETSIGSRLRDCRKAKFGGHTVESREVRRGLYEYRLIVKPPN